jgi:hypothetical protein
VGWSWLFVVFASSSTWLLVSYRVAFSWDWQNVIIVSSHLMQNNLNSWYSIVSSYTLNCKRLILWGAYIYTVRTSQETQYVSATEPNRLMLFRETVAVYCENHTLCGQNAEFMNVTAGGVYSNHSALKSVQDKSAMSWQASVMHQATPSRENESCGTNFFLAECSQLVAGYWHGWMIACSVLPQIPPFPRDRFLGRNPLASQQPPMYVCLVLFRHYFC